MTPLHADDDMGQAAHDAAMFASGLDFNLLAASSPNLTRAQRAAHLRKALRQWQPLCRAMATLAMASPVSSTQAETEDANLRDWIEGKAA